MSDQELGEVFADSDEENHTESPASEFPQRVTDFLSGGLKLNNYLVSQC